jgi:ABC-type spermidine/putrescine transport system permease subunit II
LVPFIVLVVRTRLEKIDPRVEEAGRDLGSRPSRVFRTVTLPMLTPSLLGAGLLAAAISLDDLLVTNFTIGANATVPVWIASQMRVGLTPALNAVSVLMLIGSLGLIALAAIVVSFRRSMRLSTMLAER